METITALPSWLHPLARRRALHLERTRQAHDQILAWRVQDSLAELGLTHMDYSIAGGRVVHIPEVVTVSDGPPRALVVRMLPGQKAEHFATKAREIAYYLGVAKVDVVPLERSLIRLELSTCSPSSSSSSS